MSSRTAEQTGLILYNLSKLNFGPDFEESPFRLTWPQLRAIASVPRLTFSYLKDVNLVLLRFELTLIPMNNSLLIADESQLNHYRLMPDRILEDYLPEGFDPDGEIEDDEI